MRSMSMRKSAGTNVQLPGNIPPRLIPQLAGGQQLTYVIGSEIAVHPWLLVTST